MKGLWIWQLARIATRVAGALECAHRQNVIHRDIKPETILLQDGQALVADGAVVPVPRPPYR